jgi:NAD(P) transhydrogenase
LNLLAAGLQSDEQGRLWCNEHGQTWARHIYGIGDVVGFPEVSQVSLDQAGRVLRHAFGDDGQGCSAPAFGLKTICGLAMCGATEERLRDDLVAYEVGTARFVDDSYRPSGEGRGFLKLLFHRESLELLGVHCLSESAVELIRLGQIVMSLGGTIEAFRDKNFQGVPLSDCYRLAAEDGFARIAGESADCQPRSQTGSCRSSASCRRPALSPR